jgi:hypothetical protein
VVFFEPKTVQYDVLPAGEPAAGGLARVLPQRLFDYVSTLLNEVEKIEFYRQSRIRRLHSSNP